MVIYDAKLMDDWLYAGFKVDIGQSILLLKPIANVFMLMTHTNGWLWSNYTVSSWAYTL